MRLRPGIATTALLVLPALVSLACAPVSLAAAPAAAPSPAPGTRLDEALRSLGTRGVQFIFSSQLVTAQMRVQQASTSKDAVQVARDILQPFGLALQAVQPGVFAVVRGRVPPPVTAPSTSEPLSTVVVTASRFRIGDLPSELTLLSPELLTSAPGLGDDPVRTIGRLPGFARNGFSARTHVRGGEQSEVLTLLDGFPLRDAFHLPGYQGLFSLVDSSLLAGADVYTGGFPAVFGDRMSAVLDLHGIGATDEPRHSVAIDFFNASARAGGELGPATDFLVLGRVGTLKPLLEATDSSVARPSYGDAYLRLSSMVTADWRITANLLWSQDELLIEEDERGEVAEMNSRRRYLWLQGRGAPTDALDAQWWVGQTELRSTRDGRVSQAGFIEGQVADDRSAVLYDLRGRLGWQRTDRDFVQGGLELTRARADYDYAASARYSPVVASTFGIGEVLQREAHLSPSREHVALFVSDRRRIVPALSTELGFRTQRLITRGQDAEWITEPRVALRWQWAPRTAVRASWGQFNQIDEIDELRVEDGATRFPLPQRSDHVVLSVQHRATESVSLRAEAFHKRQSTPRVRFENLLNPQTILAEIGADRVRVAPDGAAVRGLELTAEVAQDAWRGSVSVSRSFAYDRIDGNVVPRSWDQTWTLVGNAAWRRGPWELSGSLDLHRGWPLTPIVQRSDGTPAIGRRNSTHLGTFLELDLRAVYTQPVSRGTLRWSAELMNAQVRRNDCCTELLGDPATGALYTNRLRWLPVVPSLGLRWSY